MKVNPLHWYWSDEHLIEVILEMLVRGPPVLRGYFDGSVWHAIEGTHRLHAAFCLNLIPVMVPAKWRKAKKALAQAQHSRWVLDFGSPQR